MSNPLGRTAHTIIKSRSGSTDMSKNLGKAVETFYKSNYQSILENDLDRRSSQKIVLILITSSSFDYSNSIENWFDEIKHNSILNLNFNFLWTGWDWSEDLLNQFNQPFLLAGEDNIFYTKEFNSGNFLTEFFKNRLEELCGAKSNLAINRQVSLGKGDDVPKLAITSQYKSFLDESCGEAPNFMSDETKHLDYSLWLDSTSTSSPHSRIYYGQNAQLGRWPWFISIGKCQCQQEYSAGHIHADDMHKCLTSPMKSYFCGGSIISPRYGISALHCFRHKNDLQKWYGGDSGQLREDSENSPPLFTNSMLDLQYCTFSRTGSLRVSTTTNFNDDLRRISRVYWPKSWQHNSYDYELKRRIEGLDVVVLKWETPYEFSNLRQPICVPDFNTIPEDWEVCWLVGYGKMAASSLVKKSDKTLQQMPLKYYPINDCSKFYKFTFKDFTSRFQNSTCFNTKNKLDATQCSGDSGGPVMCDINGRFVQFGAVSMRAGKCGDSSVPAVFGGVSSILPFLCRVVEENDLPRACEQVL